MLSVWKCLNSIFFFPKKCVDSRCMVLIVNQMRRIVIKRFSMGLYRQELKSVRQLWV